MTWPKAPIPEGHPQPAVPVTRKSLPVSREYLPLFKYLDQRFADVVVLTFTQVEDILGASLPPGARLEAAWWSDEPADDASAAQSRAWTQAHRTATPNLPAGAVRFERRAG
jgi:hypothetical protein